LTNKPFIYLLMNYQSNRENIQNCPRIPRIARITRIDFCYGIWFRKNQNFHLENIEGKNSCNSCNSWTV